MMYKYEDLAEHPLPTRRSREYHGQHNEAARQAWMAQHVCYAAGKAHSYESSFRDRAPADPLPCGHDPLPQHDRTGNSKCAADGQRYGPYTAVFNYSEYREPAYEQHGNGDHHESWPHVFRPLLEDFIY